MNIEDMQLPSSNPNEDIETISRQKLHSLFDPSLFEIRDEDVRDKGIDCTIEIKAHQKYTNFRINVQLKSTHKAMDKPDAGITYTVYTSNIQYLLNGAVPAYYFLYVKSLDQFYYEDVKEILKALVAKGDNWDKQKTHSIRFRKQVTQHSIDEIYEACKIHGVFQRRLTETLIGRTGVSDDMVSVDNALNVVSDSEIRTELEEIGFQLINTGRWKEIIDLHKRATGQVAKTAKYNLILGIAYYYGSRRFDALAAFKAALRLKDELSTELQNHLLYFDYTLKHWLGLMNDVAYQAELNKLFADKNIGSYIKIERAKKAYYANLANSSANNLVLLIEELDKIINDADVPHNVKLIAQCEKLYHIGDAKNMEYMRSIARINAIEELTGPNAELRKSNARDMVEKHRKWMGEMKQLKDEAASSNNFFAYYLAWSYQTKVLYEFSVYVDMMRVAKEMHGITSNFPKEQKQPVQFLLPHIDDIVAFYTKLEHFQNVCYILSIRYEILHYLEDYKQAQDTLIHLESIITEYDLEEQKRGLEHLKKEGPTHQRFLRFMNEILEKAENEKKAIDLLIEQMQKMDEQETHRSQPAVDCYYVECLPIDRFKVPKSKVDMFFEIINAKAEEVRERFKAIWDMHAIPIANILYLSVDEEGPRDGIEASKGLVSWQNIHRIRTRFFEEGIFRVR